MSSQVEWWVTLGGHALLSVAGVAIYCRLARQLPLWDMPSPDRAHTTPTLRGAGLVFIVLMLPIMVWLMLVDMTNGLWPTLLYGGGALATVGFLDDLYGLTAPSRLIAQFIVAIATTVWLAPPPLVFLPNLILAAPLTTVLWVVAVVAFINWFNFIDGINGLAAGQAACALVCAAILLPVLWPLVLPIAGTLIGFLFWNLRGSVFMGDVGSYFLGFTLVAMAMWSVTYVATAGGVAAAAMWWSICGIIIIDPLLTMIARMRRDGVGCLFQRHHDHSYQRFAAQFGAHAVFIGALLIQIVWLAPIAWLAFRSHIPMVWVAVAYTPLVVIWFIGRRRASSPLA